MSFEYFDASGTAVADGVFIPLTGVSGLLAAELASGQAADLKLSKCVYALLEKAYEIMSPTAFRKLGFTTAKASPAGAGTNLINQNFSFTAQKVAKYDTDTITMIPLPTSGANNGLGKFSISDLFAGATKVAAGGAVAAAGFLIPTALLTNYSSLTHAGITISGTSDNRDWFAALLDWLGNAVALRSATVPSAITARSASAPSATNPSGDLIAATNPTSSIPSDQVDRHAILSKSYSITVQLALNPSTQTFDVNSVIS
jgi:hypothetical protein